MELQSSPAVGCAGLILAGGAGTRYGGPKAWATLPDGRTFLEACTATLMRAGARPAAATLPPGSDDPGIRGLSALVLPKPGLDMYASLRIGLGALFDDDAWDRVALLPVDHPLVASDTIVVLSATPAPVSIPSHRGRRGHPVVIGRTVAEGIVTGGLHGPTLRDVVHQVGFEVVDVDDSGTTANCNTPEALALATGNRVR